ncbi:MAG: ABC-type transport auxiliary lipoprotein family protein [Candidatus Acidiferrales bacterium]
MKVSRACGVVLAASAVLFCACGSAPRTSFYTIRLAPPPPSAAGSSSDQPAAAGQLGVALLQANHLLRQDRIVYFTQQNTLNFYHYHRWAESPASMVQSELIRRLQSAGIIGDVVPYHAQKGLDYVLRGNLQAMEEVDSGTEVNARFALELQLVRQEDAQMVWSDRRACERPVTTKNVDAVVEALSGCAEESLDQLTRSLGEAVSRLEAARSNKKATNP